MVTFEKREEAFEKKFVHDEELRFKATARRNMLLGLWAAEKMGLSSGEAYAKEFVVSDLEVGDHDVFAKLRTDFDARGVKQSDHQIRRIIEHLMARAVEEVKTGKQWDRERRETDAWSVGRRESP